MATHEDRITTLEQTFATFRQEIVRHTQETDENITILLGVIRRQGQDIRRISDRLETIDQRLEHLETISQRLDRLETIDQRLNRLETNFHEHTSLLTQILARLPEKP